MVQIDRRGLVWLGNIKAVGCSDKGVMVQTDRRRLVWLGNIKAFGCSGESDGTNLRS